MRHPVFRCSGEEVDEECDQMGGNIMSSTENDSYLDENKYMMQSSRKHAGTLGSGKTTTATTVQHVRIRGRCDARKEVIKRLSDDVWCYGSRTWCRS